MNKIIAVVFALFTSVLAFAQVDDGCGTRKQLIMVPESEPIALDFLIDKGGILKKVTSPKFVVSEGYIVSVEEPDLFYVLKVTPGGKSVVLDYKAGSNPAEKITGRYEYRTVGDGACAQLRSISMWRFIRTRNN
jgi:hypothetical protein